MVRVTLKNNQGSKTVNAEVTDTPQEIFENAGNELNSSKVMLDGVFLNSSELSQSLEELGVADGSKTYLSAIVKADGANK